MRKRNVVLSLSAFITSVITFNEDQVKMEIDGKIRAGEKRHGQANQLINWCFFHDSSQISPYLGEESM